MDFVKPETVRLDLNGSGSWIEVKKELTVAEEEWLLTAGYRRLGGELVVDWVMLKLAPVIAYVTDWSDKTPISEQAIRNLTKESFDELAAAVKAHVVATLEEKKARTTTAGTPARLVL